MKQFNLIIFICAILAAVACSEETDLRSKGEHFERLAVEAVLTDQTDRPQRVILSKTVPYFENATENGSLPVRGALVTVSGGGSEVRFEETQSEHGVYEAPEGYHAEQGGSYHLRIELQEGEVYEADATMPSNGFRIDDLDYAYAGNKTMGLDSLWTLAIWGQNMAHTDYYHITVGVNGHFYPHEMAEVTDDIYFNGNEVKGFPIATLMQYSQMQKLYGDCAKYLETGDEITLEAMTLSKDFFDYLMAVTLNGAMAAIPLFSPQPANCPTNIRGGDGDAVGYFALCPVASASVTVDDPLRPYYKKQF